MFEIVSLWYYNHIPQLGASALNDKHRYIDKCDGVIPI